MTPVRCSCSICRNACAISGASGRILRAASNALRALARSRRSPARRKPRAIELANASPASRASIRARPSLGARRLRIERERLAEILHRGGRVAFLLEPLRVGDQRQHFIQRSCALQAARGDLIVGSILQRELERGLRILGTSLAAALWRRPSTVPPAPRRARFSSASSSGGDLGEVSAAAVVLARCVSPRRPRHSAFARTEFFTAPLGGRARVELLETLVDGCAQFVACLLGARQRGEVDFLLFSAEARRLRGATRLRRCSAAGSLVADHAAAQRTRRDADDAERDGRGAEPPSEALTAQLILARPDVGRATPFAAQGFALPRRWTHAGLAAISDAQLQARSYCS